MNTQSTSKPTSKSGSRWSPMIEKAVRLVGEGPDAVGDFANAAVRYIAAEGEVLSHAAKKDLELFKSMLIEVIAAVILFVVGGMTLLVGVILGIAQLVSTVAPLWAVALICGVLTVLVACWFMYAAKRSGSRVGVSIRAVYRLVHIH